jgi:hypothetical protein
VSLSAASRDSPLLIRATTKLGALPLLRPTVMEVGDARLMAQGQATTRTDISSGQGEEQGHMSMTEYHMVKAEKVDD